MEKYFEHYERFQMSQCVPDFMKEHVAQAGAQLRAHEGKSMFAFVTDVHLYANRMICIPMLRELAQTYGLKTAVCGGDLPWAFGDKADCLNDGYITLNLFATLRDVMNVYAVRGNHDFTIRTSWEDDSGYTMPYEQVQAAISGACTPNTHGPADCGTYYYVDDEAAKVRYIMLDTCRKAIKGENCSWGTQYGFDEDQRQWLASDALRFEDGGEGWGILVIGHIPCDESLPSYDASMAELGELLRDLKNHRAGRMGDFSGVKAELIAYVCGHCHKDSSAVTDGALFITTGCSGWMTDDRWTRDLNTVNEELFDIFIVDQAARKLHAIRVGAGESRSFDY